MTEDRSFDVGKSINSLYFSVVVFSFGYGIQLIFIPLFARNLGASYLEIGAIGFITYLPNILGTVVLGFLADRYNRERLMLLALVLMIGSSILLYQAASIIQIIAVVVVLGSGYTLFVVCSESMASYLASEGDRVKVMGRFGAFWYSGYVIAPLVGGSISDLLGFRLLFVLTGGIYSLGALIAAINLIPNSRQWHASSAPLLAQIRRPFQDVLMKSIYLWILPWTMVLGVMYSIFPSYLKGFGLSGLEIGGVTFVFQASRIVSSFTAKTFEKLGARNIMIGSSLAYGLGFLAVPYLHGIVQLSLFVVLVGFTNGLFFPLTLDRYLNLFPKDRAGVAVGLYESLSGAGIGLGPLIAGLVADTYGTANIFVYGGLVGIISVPIFRFTFKNIAPRE